MPLLDVLLSMIIIIKEKCAVGLGRSKYQSWIVRAEGMVGSPGKSK